MALGQLNPTRMELMRFKRQIGTAKRGHKLLKDKQDEMIRQFMLIIKKNNVLRREVELDLMNINEQFSRAKLNMSEEGVLEALMIPSKTVEITSGLKTIMNVKIPTVSYVEQGTIDLTYGFAFTASLLDHAVIDLSKLLPKLIELAELEKACDMLAYEIEKTRRRVNAIEFVMIPEMEEAIRIITNKLEDNERSNIIRLMKSKEIVLAKNQARS
ncbi:MAG: V-type ATP synthase subunit D [Bacilli bacterium]|nr:V-type ATP synthase subunit D [Bacilli bacterium]